MTAPVAALTGGTGFLGRYIARAFVDAGWRVRMLIRQAPDHPMLETIPLELQRGSVSDDAALDRLVSGANVVIHAAGLVKAFRRTEFMHVNRDGAARLAAAVGRTPGQTRLVLISSLAARSPTVSAYAESKRAGEEATAALLCERRRIILRPAAIYGPWDQEGAAMLRLASGWAVPVIASPEPRIAMLHARDAAAAVLAMAQAEAEPGCYEISDARRDGYGWRELLRVIGDAIGRDPRAIPVPDAAVLAAGTARDGLAALTGRAAIFGRGKAREILHRDWSVAPERQIAAALWRPRIDLETGMRETAAWWLSNRAQRPK
jgi:nucleoside-diphosphate-sugar epimerase